ncbi:MAG: HGxxPAAW family protein [Propionicimonas sp.]|nr:HGxxPAAW family protein [Propionicimonas sp.]
MSESEEHVAGTARAYHHGRTPAAWTGSIVAAVGFTLGAVAFLLGPNWPLVWISAGVVLLAIVLGGVLRRAGYGQS